MTNGNRRIVLRGKVQEKLDRLKMSEILDNQSQGIAFGAFFSLPEV